MNSTYVRKSSRKLVFTQEILDEVRRRIGNGESQRKVAASIGMKESTLRSRLKLGTVPISLGRHKPIFTPEQEQQLADHVRELDKRFYGMSRKQLMSLAYEFTDKNKIEHRFNKDTKLAGKNWVLAFCKRHNFTLRTPEKCSLGKAIGFNKVQIERFYDNLAGVCTEEKFPAHRKFNMDESGISTVPNQVPKVLSPKGKKVVSKVASGERGQTVTIVCCMSATGIFVPPGIIFAMKRMKAELFTEAPEGSLAMISDSGFINTELFIQWLKHFHSFMKSTKEDPVLLIVDNHISHCSIEAVLFCREHHITPLSLPPHASHRLQPLDVGFFGPLKKVYGQEADRSLVNHPGTVITQVNVAKIFRSAYERVANMRIAVHAFEATGTHQFNRNIFVDEDFAPSDVTFRPDPNVNEDVLAEMQVPQNNTDEEEMPAAGEAVEIVQPCVSSAMIHPLPKKKVETKKRKGTAKKSEVLSSSPYKNSLLNMKNETIKRKCRKTSASQATTSSSSACPVEMEKVNCPGCDETYEDPITKDWVQCSFCKQWWHEDCSSYEGLGLFKCDVC